MGKQPIDTMSYVESVDHVTLHKMVDNKWETIEEKVRLDVILDTKQDIHYVAAQTPSGKFPIRTYITENISKQYVVTDNQFHTWWIPDENNKLVAWSLMFQEPQDATTFQAAIIKAGVGNSHGATGASTTDTSKPAESASLAVDFAAMKGEL